MGFKEALQFTLKWEGGFVNNPNDPGGATNKGVTQRTYNSYLARKNQSPRSVIGITPIEVEEIYKKDYWEAAGCDSLPDKIATAVFDFAVNSGVRLAKEYLEDVASKCSMSFQLVFLKTYLNKREEFLRNLRIAKYFLNGWMKRITALRGYLGV